MEKPMWPLFGRLVSDSRDDANEYDSYHEKLNKVYFKYRADLIDDNFEKSKRNTTEEIFNIIEDNFHLPILGKVFQKKETLSVKSVL